MAKISVQSKSFIVLFCLAIVGSFVCLTLSVDLLSSDYSQNIYDYGQNSVAQNTEQAAQPAAIPAIDTSSWKTYTDKKHGFSFKYKPDWKVLAPTTKNGYDILQVDPGLKYYNIKIYISSKDYYIMGGLPYKHVTVGGQPALDVSDLLYGVKYNGLYYTFDVGLSVSLKANFNALVNSVQFGS